MRKHLWILMMAAFLLLAIAVRLGRNPRATTPWYVFGDSYCDVGNLFAASGYPPAPYYMGDSRTAPSGSTMWPVSSTCRSLRRFLTGRTTPLAEHGQPRISRWERVRFPACPRRLGSICFSTTARLTPMRSTSSREAATTLWIQPRDRRKFWVHKIAKNLADSEAMLRKAGARHFVIPDLFNVGLLPAAAGKVAFASAASIAANQGLDERLAPEEQIPGVHILRMDVFSLMNAVQTAPTHFGFIDITDPCLVTTTTPPTRILGVRATP